MGLDQPGKVAGIQPLLGIPHLLDRPADHPLHRRILGVESQLQRTDLANIRPVLFHPLVHLALQRLKRLDHEFARPFAVEGKNCPPTKLTQLAAQRSGGLNRKQPAVDPPSAESAGHRAIGRNHDRLRR